MCGIIGYTGKDIALPILIGGLERLEYRGYDSAGVAVLENGKVFIDKKAGKIRELVRSLWGKPIKGKTGIGHVRWATHGEPSEENAHPHTDSKGEFAVVHNGIIENYLEIRKSLEQEGVKLSSDTDTEVIAHLVSKFYRGDLLEAVLEAVKHLKGAFAFAVISSKEPGRVVGVKEGSPLIVGIGEGENFLASDIPAILPYTRKIIPLNDGEVVDINPEGVNIYDFSGTPITKEIMMVPWDIISAEKGGFKHFMLKEIYEQPKAVNDTLKGFISKESILPVDLRDFRRLIVVACGTSYHAALVGKVWIERFVNIPVEVVYASEFKYSHTPISQDDIVMGISQSGETADTKFSLQSVKEKGIKTIAMVNVVGSSIDREADYSVYTHAGPEIGVAATKTFTAQLVALYSMAAFYSSEKEQLFKSVSSVPMKIEKALEGASHVESVANKYTKSKDFLYLGRYLNFPIALEGALKLKEISYIHAEGYPAGEMKHGPIALIDENMPVVCIAPRDRVYEKMLSNIEEVRARKGKVLSVGFKDDDVLPNVSTEFMGVPSVDEILTPFVTTIPVQLLAYYIASKLGLDVDQPRNLAKTVTVE